MVNKQFKTPQKYGAAKNKQSERWWHSDFKEAYLMKACNRCHAVFYDSHWHHEPALYEKVAAKASLATRAGNQLDKNILCPECTWIKAGFHGIVDFEGEVLLKGIPTEVLKHEIINEIRHIGTRASNRDPQDQIIKIEDKGDTIRITTTENQLAVSIAKQVARAHKGGKLEIKFSKEDKPVRIVWAYPQK